MMALEGERWRTEGRRAARRSGRLFSWVYAFALLLVVSSVSLPAGAAKYDPMRAGYPLRMVAYVMHPIGVTLDYLIMRPAYWIGSHEPFKALFGRVD